MHITVNGTALYFDVEGIGLAPDTVGTAERPVLLALHSPGYDHAYFKPGLSALTRTAQVVYLDLPGSGRSGGLPTAVTLESMADDVAAFCRTLGLSPVVLGHAAGGYVAQLLALRHPELVRGLVLVGTGPTGDLSEGMSVLERRHGPATRAAAERVFGGDFSPAATDAFSELVLPAYLDDPATSRDAWRAWASCRHSPEMFRRLIEELAPRFDVWERLPEIAAPTVVIAGANDWLHPPASARALARRLPDAKVVVISGAGHFPFAEQPEWFCAAARVLLGALEPLRRPS